MVFIIDRPDTTETKSDTVANQQQSVLSVDDPFDMDKMLPYLSPTSLFAEEEEAVRRRADSNWGRHDIASNRRESLQRWQESKDEGGMCHIPKVSSEEAPQHLIVAAVSSQITTVAASESTTTEST